MLQKLSRICYKNVFSEILACSRTLGISVTSDLHIKVTFYIIWKKNNLGDFLLWWRLFYWPNLEISSLIRQGSQGPRGKEKI